MLCDGVTTVFQCLKDAKFYSRILEANVPRCIFCPNELDDQTKPEHILLDALGGRNTTTQVICSNCNNLFGNEIDKAIAQQVPVIRNLLQLPTGTRSAPPTLRRVIAGRDTLNIKGDGSFRRVAKPFSIKERPDGNADVRIEAHSLEEIEKLIPHIAAALKVPENDLRKQLAQSEVSMIERRPDTVHFSLSFGGQNAIRSAAKACVVLWTTLVGNNETISAPYDAVRSYIYEGNATFNSNRTHLDSRFLECTELITKKYGRFFNCIYVRSNADGRVVGHFTLYNVIGFQIVLAERGGSPNRRIALISNPLDPVVWSDNAAEEFDISFEWLDAPDYSGEMKRSLERINSVMRHHFEVSRPKEIERICDEVFRKHGIGENQNIPEKLIGQIINEISLRLAKHALSLPHEEKITTEKIREIFLRNLPADEQ